MLHVLASWEVCTVKNYNRGLENAAQGRRLRAGNHSRIFHHK